MAQAGGWNDCSPAEFFASKKFMSSNESLLSLKSVSSSVPLSGKQPSTVSLPCAPPPPPSSGIRRGNGPPVAKFELSDNEPDREQMEQRVTEKLSKVLSFPTSIKDKEFAFYSKKLTTVLPDLKIADLEVIESALDLAIQGYEGKSTGELAEGKNIVVQYTLLQTGVSTWGLPLRKVIEMIKME